LATAIAALGGAAGGGLDVLFPSLQADVIDYDELRTGERKEGVYFATWHVAAKSATGVAGMLVGFVLSSTGFQPNVAQSESAQLAMRSLMSGLPFVCYTVGMLIFSRFALTQGAHRDVRAQLDARAALEAEPAGS
ncbi:MAG: MFS transporter, partial [Proteobacteria bacterium]|nr:MFS transporter [Pseudomonadota bacterium]